MITRVYLKNFRGIGEEVVDLQQMTVLVGKNGAGKSSFVDALRFVRDALTLGLEDAILIRHGISALRRWAPTRPYDLEIGLEIRTSRTQGEYGFVLASGKEGDFKVKHEYGKVSRMVGDEERTARFERKGSQWTELPTERVRSGQSLDATALALPSIGFFTPDFHWIQRFLREMTFYTIFPNTLREPQKPSPSRTLTDHGENLATIARKLKSQGRHKTIVKTLNKIVGGISDIEVQQVGGFLVTQLLHSMNEDQKTWFDLSQESDGTLRLLGILVALFQFHRLGVSFVVIEEPELTLHPGAMGILSDVLKEASLRKQLLITTQSPDLIARFPADSLRVVERGKDGLTTISLISEHQRKAIDKQLFSAGDLLRIEGLQGAANS